MDITRSFVSERDRALLGGDYETYHAQASRRIHAIRKRLGITTPRGKKYTPKSLVTSEDVSKSTEWIQLLLASSERAWADAMSMKSSQSFENTQKPMAGSTKRQVVSRLRRAISYADNLVLVLQDTGNSVATNTDLIEAMAYRSLMKGGLAFEKGQWAACVQSYSAARIVYASLGKSAQKEMYKELLANVVDPSLRYAAYQQKLPRTKAVPEIASENFPSTEQDLRKRIEGMDPGAFETSSTTNVTKQGPKEVPTSISWRSRNVKLEDANISQALGLAQEFEQAVLQIPAGSDDENKSRLAAAHEDVITARQDAVDATKTAIDELSKEGVDPGDTRMQSLQITRTAVNYGVIEWRVGRNRILCGPQDGLIFTTEKAKMGSKARKDGRERLAKEESTGRQVSRLRERVALYDSILQSSDTVRELPGVIADEEFVQELEMKRGYFRALKCLAIGRSHVANGEVVHALALFARGEELAKSCDGGMAKANEDGVSAPKFGVTKGQISALQATATNLVRQYRALAELKNLGSHQGGESRAGLYKTPMIERLHLNQYDDQVDLQNLVHYPPRLRPVPVKPLFFDLAWNYINYPGRSNVVEETAGQTPAPAAARAAVTKEDEPKAKPRSWFGFGR